VISNASNLKVRSVFVDRRQFESPLQEQVEKATQYVLEKINMGAQFHGVYREDVYEIPPDAIRELIVNAVVHRSYVDGEASPITVALYDDRLEVTSPGGLVRGMTLEKMVSGYSDCRNKAIAAAFAYMNLIENWGSGVKRYIDAIKGAGLREPEFVVWPNAVRVNVYRHKEVPAVVEPNEPNREPNEPNREPNEPNREPNDPNVLICELETKVLGLLSESAEITIDDLAKACGVSRETVKRTLKSLKKAGRIQRIGKTRGYWKITSGK
jgi:ATP-dependent DNA helicase RecG